MAGPFNPAVNPLLQKVWSRAYQPDSVYVAPEILGMPIVVPCSARAGSYFVDDADNSIPHAAVFAKMARAPGAERAIVTLTDSTAVPYTCQPYGLKTFVSEEDRKRALHPEDMRDQAINRLMVEHRGQREYELSLLLTTAANYPAGNTSTLAALPGGSGAKFGAAGATEIRDLLTAIEIAEDAMNNNKPNFVIIGKSAARLLKRATDLNLLGDNLDRTALTYRALAARLVDKLEVSKVIIGRASYKTAAGAKTDIWPDSVVIGWQPHFGEMANTGVVIRQDGVKGGPRLAVEIVEDLYDSGSMPALDHWDSKDPKGEYHAADQSRVVVGPDLTNAYLLRDCA